jgi:predicted aspartyl protease
VGTFYVDAVLPGRKSVRALVDTGATFSKLPAGLLRALKVAPAFITKVKRGDGRIVSRKVGYVSVKLNGHSAPVPVMFGGRAETALIGATTLEILGLAADPVRRVLVESIHLEI